jgi:hypothetical protein
MFLGHPDYPQYGFYLLALTPELEDDLDRLGPVSMISGTYDWPNRFGEYRNWTDQAHSLWWPDEAEAFASCILVIDDARNDSLVRAVQQQQAAIPTGTWRWPYLILSALLSPAEGRKPDGTFAFSAESYAAGGQGPVGKETPLVEWKMYPLQAVNLTSLTADEKYRGLWLLPLVDIRYFYRNVPLNQFPGGSSSSGLGPEYPFITVSQDLTPDWMPPVRGYPRDLAAPLNFVPIPNQGTSLEISNASRWGVAADEQARMNNWRIVCRDVRSNYNPPPNPQDIPHAAFTGVVADYPEDWAAANVQSYHTDAIALLTSALSRISGGLCDLRIQNNLTARKLQFLFDVRNTDTALCITIQARVDYPITLNDLSEDVDGPDDVEKTTIPMVMMGVQASDRYPGTAERDTLVSAAKRWALLYYAWRHRQCFIRVPGIVPIIPNGHAHMIRWDFQTSCFQTTYVAIEGVQGTDTTQAAKRSPFYARIDGEGSLRDGLHGVYAYTELRDHDGVLSDDQTNPKRGFVQGVNGKTQTYNPARDEYGKVAVPVGLIVLMRPGTPYLDMSSGKIFDHMLFTTGDLSEIAVLKQPLERSPKGFYGITIKRWNPDTVSWDDSRDDWAVILG